jgi:hypothetical protein
MNCDGWHGQAASRGVVQQSRIFGRVRARRPRSQLLAADDVGDFHHVRYWMTTFTES